MVIGLNILLMLGDYSFEVPPSAGSLQLWGEQAVQLTCKYTGPVLHSHSSNFRAEHILA